MIRHISIIILFSISSGLYAQKPVNKTAGLPVQKPVETAGRKSAQKPDSLKAQRILRQWNLSSDFSEEVNSPVDTLFSLCNRFKIADKFSPVNATLGNYGLPFYQINFFDRITDPDKFLYSTYFPFMFTPEQALFMNTQVPFTELAWSFAGKRETSEQTFRVKHSQNINRFWNVGITYDIIFALGQYNYQRAEDKNATFFSSYTGKRYKLYLSAGINNMIALENGGITDKSELGKGDTRDVPVKLGSVNSAKSTLKNRNLLLVQRYTVGTKKNTAKDSTKNNAGGSTGLSGTFSHILVIDNSRRLYADKYPVSGFYDSVYISTDATYDSLSSKSMKNTVRFDFETDPSRKFRLGGGFGFRNEVFRYGQVIPTHDTTLADSASWNRINNAITGRLFNSVGDKFRWTATGELYLSGFKAGDFNINGIISSAFDMKKGRASWIISGGIMNRQPSFWFNQWGGNNFEWHNEMKKEFRIDVGSSISYPARKTGLKFNYAVIKNYADFDSTAMPAQYTGGISVAAITLNKGMKAWKFHLDTDITLQTSTNDNILDLPVVALRAAGYFEHIFRFRKTGGRLMTQLGADVTYHSLYHPYSYMPATGRFYRQYEADAGNYPFINIFLNIKLQRTRLFLMFDHLNSGMMGENIRYNYDMVPLYPMNISMFRFGLAWTFYN